ncbi:hypothetical protein DSCO28_31980 [Desulfosarcina ovata subsp. sediminis]|uniref:Uncharacterized protein n=1 Tax=Desulfosarcina ovata subsp. sediminis TaxID=885957 RepID=A0A5K7ZKD9_9BACT|nr:tetratricopeptide repeat protein [Desulfosarcina ovata]BBO82632.1 hypothetical protein DSCO28_31980 [Desulfosarcina ovata subsp. sediminis]
MSGIESVLANSLTWEPATTILDEQDATDILSILANQSDGMAEMSNEFLDSGITSYANGDYEEAATAFEAAYAIDPDNDNSTQTVQYLAQSYLKLEKTGKAIEAYEKAIEQDPTNTTFRTSLAQLYITEERYDDAKAQYARAVGIDDSAENLYSYGESLLLTEDYEDAEEQFKKVIRLESDSTAGYYGLGKTYAEMEDYENAIEQFETALEIDPEFYDAMAEIGYAYADMGETELAREVLEDLEDLDEDLADTLEDYIDMAEAPQISFAYSSSTFPYQMTSGYAVSAIDSYLENAGASKTVTMVFQFSKSMDADTVEDVYNWSITRSDSNNMAEDYNFGQEVPDTEATLNYYPDSVVYDWDEATATVTFTIHQNETADATIDPSHIVFTFDGECVYGVSMDEDADEYSGFSGVA